MKMIPSLVALALALVVNGLTIAALNRSMTDSAERAMASLQEPARILVSAKRTPSELATAQCPAPKAL